MHSLEVLVITVFALVAIFAAVPVVVQQIYYFQSLVETRAVVAFFNVVADSVESDLGASYVQRAVAMPFLRFGSFTYLTSVVGRCGGKPIYNTTFVYESSYLSVFGFFRGVSWGAVVDAPDSPIAVRGWGTAVSMVPRVVRYGGVAVVFNMTYVAARGGNALYYRVYAPKSFSVGECTLGVGGGVERVLVVDVVFELR